MRKKTIIAIACLFLASIIAVSFIHTSEPQVIGKLQPSEITEIKHAVREQIWRGTMPRSWAALKLLPENIQFRASSRLSRIEVLQTGMARVEVVTGDKSQTRPTSVTSYSYLLKKDAKGWKIFPAVGDFDLLF